jgi:hypothetical protein
VEYRCRGGPLHGWPVAARAVRASEVWLDREGRCHGAPSRDAPRFLYRAQGSALVFVGHGARRCDGCGVTVDPDPETGGMLYPCPLCGATLEVYPI